MVALACQCVWKQLPAQISGKEELAHKAGATDDPVAKADGLVRENANANNTNTTNANANNAGANNRLHVARPHQDIGNGEPLCGAHKKNMASSNHVNLILI